jgi:hypothetical protein
MNGMASGLWGGTNGDNEEGEADIHYRWVR